MFSLQVGINHQNRGGIIVHITHDDGQSFQSGHLCGELAAVAGDNLVAVTIRARPCDKRSQHTKLSNAFHCSGHGFIVHNFERMVGERMQLINGDLLYLLSFFFLPLLLGGK